MKMTGYEPFQTFLRDRQNQFRFRKDYNPVGQQLTVPLKVVSTNSAIEIGCPCKEFFDHEKTLSKGAKYGEQG
jgi:hypothetical protein